MPNVAPPGRADSAALFGGPALAAAGDARGRPELAVSGHPEGLRDPRQPTHQSNRLRALGHHRDCGSDRRQHRARHRAERLDSYDLSDDPEQQRFHGTQRRFAVSIQHHRRFDGTSVGIARGGARAAVHRDARPGGPSPGRLRDGARHPSAEQLSPDAEYRKPDLPRRVRRRRERAAGAPARPGRSTGSER